ncbi:MAG: N-acetylmuramoyl-L-alanine amidase [Planctomycetota bacterium]|nr:MAG: N-acetylmuramoyl-L-alanine amidase [Planctomycetota bacterium]
MMWRFLTILMLPAVLVGCNGSKRVITRLPPPAVPMVSSPKAPVTPAQPPKVPSRSVSGTVIVVDAGHGGKDPGAGERTKSRLPEKTINLDIARKVGRMLSDRGARVVYTRTSDVFIELADRAALAERNRADLFVSIHADSHHNPDISGTKVFIYERASMQSRRAGLCMVDAFKEAGIACRGLNSDNFHVLREHSRPAVLIECGYLTNGRDAGMLNTSSYRSRIAGTIVEGIVDYFSRYGS